jgi:lycopene cyclase domain-containing protein
MATYLILNIIFILIVCIVARVAFHRPSKAFVATFIVLIILTAVFDNVIVGLSIVDYDPAKILEIKIGFAPIEDFMYAVLAVIIVPIVWHRLGSKHAQ